MLPFPLLLLWLQLCCRLPRLLPCRCRCRRIVVPPGRGLRA